MNIDRINALDNLQDTTCVVSITEAIFKFIKRVLPYIMTGVLHSDDTIFYQNAILLLFIHILINSNVLFMLVYIHTDTGSGRRVPDFGGQFCPIFRQEKDDFLTTTVKTLFDKNSTKQFYIRQCVQIFNYFFIFFLTIIKVYIY